jgi:hypothetical protein
MVWKERLRSLPKASVAFAVLNEQFVVMGTTREIKTSPGQKWRLPSISRFREQAHWLLSFLIAAASVLLALQPQSRCAQNASDQDRLDSQTNGEEAVKVKAYGAVGDGVANDTAAFIKTLATCAAAGGTCLVPEATDLISASGSSTGLSATFIHRSLVTVTFARSCL